MDYIARHYNMDLALVWALRLEGKTDQEKFKELGWGLRTWDQWNFNECDERFGDDWPGRIPAQLIAHTLFYFTKPGDVVLDPMAGGGVVSDVCMLFERKCRAFDIATRDNRPEIQYHHWESRGAGWPIAKKPDLIIFDPPYYIKKEKAYREKAKEKPDKSITIFDYHRLLSKTGWKVTHRIECPLSSERLSGNQVQKMQDKRILGTVGRTLLIAKRS